jgi:putative DNA primase/helicase
MLKALNIPLEEFLRPFFDPGETVCIRIFDDKKTGAFKGAKLETTVGQIDKMMKTLNKHNAKNRGIYFVDCVQFARSQNYSISLLTTPRD